METLILKNGTKKDLQLLIDIAKKIGLDLRIAEENVSDKREKLLAVAKRLDKSVKPNDISDKEIIDECNNVRKEIYE